MYRYVLKVQVYFKDIIKMKRRQEKPLMMMVGYILVILASGMIMELSLSLIERNTSSNYLRLYILYISLELKVIFQMYASDAKTPIHAILFSSLPLSFSLYLSPPLPPSLPPSLSLCLCIGRICGSRKSGEYLLS